MYYSTWHRGGYDDDYVGVTLLSVFGGNFVLVGD